AAVTAHAVFNRAGATAALILKLVLFDVDRHIGIIAVAVVLKVEIDPVQEVVVAWVRRLLAGLVTALSAVIAADTGFRGRPIVGLAWLEKFGGIRILLAVAGDILFRRHFRFPFG